MNDNSNTPISRRGYLAGGAALVAGVVLPGCGGGDDALSTTAGADGTEVLAAKMTTTEYPLSSGTAAREVYFVEIAHRGTLQSRVLIGWRGSSSATVSDKPGGTTASAFAIDYATLDNTPSNRADSAATRTTFRDELYVNVVIGGRTQIVGRNYAGANPQNVTKGTYSYDGTDETELLFAYSGVASTTNWDVAVRFFKAASADMGARRGDWITEVVRNDPHHDHNQGLSHSYPLFYPLLPAANAAHTLGVIQNTSTGADTLSVPSHRHSGHRELVRPVGLVQTSTAARNHNRRRLERHMVRHANAIRAESAPTTANIGDKGTRMHNELMKALFGGTIGDKITNAITNSVTKIKNATNFTVNNGLETLANAADDLDTDANWADIQRALNETPRQPALGSAGGGASAAVSLQAKVEANFLMPFIEYPSHVGVRASMLIARQTWASLTADGVNSAKTTTYRLSQRAASGYKVTVTGILGPTWSETICSVDVEVNVAMTIKNDTSGVRRCRVDAITLDPVLDINLRDWTGKLLEKAMAKVLDRAAGMVSNGNVATIATPVANGPAAAATWTNFANALDPGIVSGAMVAAAATKLEQMAIAAMQTAGRTWSLIEVSPLRMSVFNSDAFESYFGTFRGGFQGAASFAYMPGVKYLAGTGFEVKNTAVAGVLRVFGGGDAYMLYGTKGVQGAVLTSSVTGGST